MPVWLITLLPYFLNLLQSVLPMLEHGIGALPADHPAVQHLQGVQANLIDASSKLQAAIAT